MVTDPSPRTAQTNGTAIPAFFLYGEPPRPPDARTIHVETIASRSRLHDWTIRAHRHGDLGQVLLVLRGRAIARIEGLSLESRGAMLAIVPPGAVHGFSFERATKGVVVTFSAALAQGLIESAADLAALLDRPAALRIGHKELESTELGRLGPMMLRESGRMAPGRDIVMRGLLGTFLASALRVVRGQGAKPAQPASRHRELVARFRHSIEKHHRRHLSVAAHARELGCSAVALRRACHAAAGQAPIELAHRHLLLEAQRRLHYTALSVAEIAYQLGFEDPAYFSRFFAKRMGISPRAFRAADAPSLQ
jgi:AraC family transcriptional activator of pobA